MEAGSIDRIASSPETTLTSSCRRLSAFTGVPAMTLLAGLRHCSVCKPPRLIQCSTCSCKGGPVIHCPVEVVICRLKRPLSPIEGLRGLQGPLCTSQAVLCWGLQDTGIARGCDSWQTFKQPSSAE